MGIRVWIPHHRSASNPSATKKTLSELDLGETGYYLLEFDNGDCYLGQSVDISERLKGHRLVHKDISSIRLSPDPAAARMANPYAISCASSENSSPHSSKPGFTPETKVK